MLGSFIVISSEKWIMFSNYLLLEANECCGTCDILLKKCILHCLDGPKFHRFDTKDQGSIQSSTTPDPRYQWESDKLTVDTTNESQEVSPFPAGDHKAHTNKRAHRHSKHKTEQKHKRSTKDPASNLYGPIWAVQPGSIWVPYGLAHVNKIK